MNKKNVILLGIANLILIGIVIFSIISLSVESKNKSFNQNVENIVTLTDASSNKVELLFTTYSEVVKSVTRYINHYNDVGMTPSEIEAFFKNLYDSNQYRWQLVEDYYDQSPSSFYERGFYTLNVFDLSLRQKCYNPFSYPNLAKIFKNSSDEHLDEIIYTSEFMDIFTLNKSFAVASYVRVKNEDNTYAYRTLMLVVSSDVITNLIGFNNTTDNHSFFDYSDIIIDYNGNYVISSQYFQGTNVLDYIETYNKDNKEFNRETLLEELKTGKMYENIYLKNNRGQDCVYTISPVNGTKWYMVSLVPIDSFHNTQINTFGYYFFFFGFAILFVVDMLYVITINKKLRQKTKEASEASKAKGNFMSKMSHEIRTPLNAIIGYNNIAQNEIKEANQKDNANLERKVQDCLAKSEIASKHLLTVINDVLDMSAIESGKVKVAHEKFDLKGLIISLTTVFYSQARKNGVDLDVIMNELTEEWFVGDQLRINQILTNIISNAIKFTPEGGNVKITVTEEEKTNESVNLHFQIADTGIGMTKEYLNRIWSPFEQADSTISRRFGGSGLGLAITKNLVDLMNGKIKVTSEVGEGSTFDLDFTFGRTTQPSKTNMYDFSNINALIIDNDVNTCNYIQLLFERCGARSSQLQSIDDAIGLYQEGKEAIPYSLCLIDWRLINKEGVEKVKEFKRITKNHIPIIVLAAYDYNEVVEKANEIGITHFVEKPLFQSSILDLLVNITNKKHVNKNALSLDKPVFNGEHILIAEDNQMNMEIAKNIIQRIGLHVDTAWNGKEAIDKFMESKDGEYKLILMDVHMPETDGYKATKIIRNSSHPNAKSIPIIALTADAFAEDVEKAIEIGMNDHISKPIDINDLINTLNKYLSK